MSEQEPERVALLCSFNLELIERDLTTALERHGVNARLVFSDYGQWESSAIDPASRLYAFDPDIVIVFPDTADLTPPLAPESTLPTEEAARALGEAAWRRVDTVLSHLIGNLPPTATVLCCNAVAPALSSLALLEGNAGHSWAPIVEVFNQRLRQRCAAGHRLVAIDYAAVVLKHGWRSWHDRRLWHLARMRLAREALTALADVFARYVAALRRPRRKCLVLDLDNTLWGGVIGEDGITGIQIGHEGLGLAYREFQLAVLALAKRGVILGVISKNNPDEAMVVFRDHPDMVLRQEHFACMRINWHEKPDNLRYLAERLNLGLDSIVFWDDNPVERAMMREQLPEVYVPDVSEDPTHYAAILLDLACFDAVALTAEDRQRGKMYRQQACRDEYLERAKPTSLEEFYASLNLVVSIEPVKAQTVARVAQLTQRSNQFNFTARRYSANDIEAMIANPDYQLHTLRVRDRFGELGIVGTTIVHAKNGTWMLDSFLMSCRALGRGVEDALFASVASRARAEGASVVGHFVPTRKNAPAREFLAKHGVAPPADWNGDLWAFSVPRELEQPRWITQDAIEDENG